MYLEEGFKELNIDFTEELASKFGIFYDYLVSENEKYNLTRITDKDNAELFHFIDSLLPYEYIRGTTLCDVGSGGGFPAIPLKLVFPNLKLTMLDSLSKRVNFLNCAVSKLGLKNAEALHIRAEEGGRFSLRESFDTVTARALAPFNVLTELCLPLVKKGGIFIAYKSDSAEEEILKGKNAVELLGGSLKIVKKQLPLTDIVRVFAIVEKVKSTPSLYPRQYGKITKKPL